MRTPRALRFDRLPAVVLLGALLVSSWGCASQKTAPAAPPQEAAPPERVHARSPLTADEAILRERLRTHVTELAQTIGERNPQRPWELAAAADYVALQFEEQGFAVERLGYEVDGAAVQNLAVTLPGTHRGDEVVIVGAHYDSAPGSKGENGNATGVAALLELARMFRGATNARTLRLVAFAVCSPPYAGSEHMGSLRYAEELRRGSQQVVGMISLDGIGVLTPDAPTGQGVAQVRLGATGGEGADRLREILEQELDADPLAVQLIAVDAAAPTDHWAFAKVGIPAVWVTGLGAERAIDYDAMARLVMRVRFGLGEILGEVPTNDGMLTPDLGLGD